MPVKLREGVERGRDVKLDDEMPGLLGMSVHENFARIRFVKEDEFELRMWLCR